ncbi:MAG: hypothetical protein H6718_00235 [Polyangiaceae bacterium]|nr:hypothetical protein [Polyangiaceae bacterium]
MRLRSWMLVLVCSGAIACGNSGGDPEGSGGTAGGNAGGAGGTGGGSGGAGGASGSGGTAGIGGTAGTVNRPPAAEDWTRDVLSTDLRLDLGALQGEATITLRGGTSEAASFEVRDLEITSVSDSQGPLNYVVNSGQLDVGVPAAADQVTLSVVYGFHGKTNFNGWMPSNGVSFLWPYFCGALYPCKSEPADGLKFTLDVTGYDPGSMAVYPSSIPADAPSYIPAVAVGSYTKLDLGKTQRGTTVSTWHLPGEDGVAATGLNT